MLILQSVCPKSKRLYRQPARHRLLHPVMPPSSAHLLMFTGGHPLSYQCSCAAFLVETKPLLCHALS